MSSDQVWQRLGELLIRRRLDLDPRYRNRQVFADERGAEYRIVSDIERARRTNFHAVTIAEIERAYGLSSGAIGRFLAGGELEGRRETVTRLPVPRRLPKASPELAEAMRSRVEEIKALVSAASRRYPGEQLSGAQIFPRSETVAAWYWDRLQSDGWAPEDMPGGVAAQLILEGEETGHESGSATG